MLSKTQYSGYENTLVLHETEDLQKLVEKKDKIDREIKKSNLLIHQFENGERTKKSVLELVKKNKQIHTFGPNYGVLVGVFPFKSQGGQGGSKDSGKDKIKPTILIKSYDIFKGTPFFYGDASITLNQAELKEVVGYASKILEKQGINFAVEKVEIDDESGDELMELGKMNTTRDSETDSTDSAKDVKKEKKEKKKKESKEKRKCKTNKRKRAILSSSDDSDSDLDQSDDRRKAKSARF